jgi:hypothetical protein
MREVLAAFVAIFILTITTTNLSGLVYLNGSIWVFCEESMLVAKASQMTSSQQTLIIKCGTKDPTQNRPNTDKTRLETCINEGATNFIGAYSHFLLFLQNVEASELNKADYESLQSSLDKAIEKMEKAREIYAELVKKTESIPYNESAIEKVKKFNYERFRERNHLKKEIFDKVKGFLINGDIRGIYKEVLSQINSMTRDAKVIRTKLKTQKSILASEVWHLNQLYSDSMFFGQYVAQVFDALIAKKETSST